MVRRSYGSENRVDRRSYVEKKMNNEIHEGVNCDSCGKENITGIRYKCMECPNYDMCESCMAKPREQPELHSVSKVHTNEHMILKVPKWSQTKKFPLLTNREKWVHKGIQCFHCNKQNIIGWRYLCVQCGINICEVCERTGEHTLSHPLLKMVPIQEPISNVPGITFIQPTQPQFGFNLQQPPAQPQFGFNLQQSTHAQPQFGFNLQQSTPAQPVQQSSFGFAAPQPAQQSSFGFAAPQPAQQSSFGFVAPQPAQQSSFSFAAPQPAQQSLFGFASQQGNSQNIFGKK